MDRRAVRGYTRVVVLIVHVRTDIAAAASTGGETSRRAVVGIIGADERCIRRCAKGRVNV